MPIEHNIQNKEKIKNAINDARVLKLPDSMTKEISQLFDHVQWRDEAENLWEKVQKHHIRQEETLLNSSVTSEVITLERVQMKEFEKIIQEGKKKNYIHKQVQDLWQEIDNFSDQVSKSL